MLMLLLQLLSNASALGWLSSYGYIRHLPGSPRCLPGGCFNTFDVTRVQEAFTEEANSIKDAATSIDARRLLIESTRRHPAWMRCAALIARWGLQPMFSSRARPLWHGEACMRYGIIQASFVF